MTRKRVLFIGPLPPPVTGASLRNKSLIESPLINAALEIELIAVNFAEEVDDIGRFSFTKVIKGLQQVFAILRKIMSYKPHLVYFNISLYGFALYRDLIYVMVIKILSSRILYHLRTQGVKSQVQKSWLKRLMFQFIFKNTRVVSLSQYLSHDVEDVYEKQPIIVNNGIKDIAQGFKRESKPNQTPPTILFLAHLWLFKGLIDLIDAYSILKSKKIKFKAIIAGPEGDISIAALKEKVAACDLREEVEIVGPKFGEEKNELFKAVDIFVLPTTFEGFPGAVLEAMQFGLPVVATVEGAIPEIVDDGATGFLVRKKDAPDLADKLEILISNPSRREEFGKNGRIKFEHHYTLQIFEEKMLSVFKNVMDESQNE